MIVKDVSVTMVNQTHGHLPIRPRKLEGKFDIQFPIFTRLICAVRRVHGSLWYYNTFFV